MAPGRLLQQFHCPPPWRDWMAFVFATFSRSFNAADIQSTRKVGHFRGSWGKNNVLTRPPSLWFLSDLRASWEEWWTYDGISGEFIRCPLQSDYYCHQHLVQFNALLLLLLMVAWGKAEEDSFQSNKRSCTRFESLFVFSSAFKGPASGDW